MVRDIITYPDKRIHIITPDLRKFDESLFSLIDDLKDTIKANNLDALSANQIGIHKSVIVVKENDEDFLVIINPRELSKKERFVSLETTSYYPNIEMEVPRFKKLKIVYQDEFGKQCYISLEGDRAVLLQRKIDYCYGATLANRISPKVREKFEKEVSSVIGVQEVCPAQPLMRDYMKSFMTKLLILEFFTLFSKFFSFSKSTIQSIYHFDIYISIALLILLPLYIVIGYKESKIYTNCSTCHFGYVVATFLQYLLISVLMFTISWYFLGS